MSADNQIKALKLDLPPAPKPAGVYQPVLILGDLAFVSGHGPLLNDESYITGKAGAELDAEAAKAAARSELADHQNVVVIERFRCPRAVHIDRIAAAIDDRGVVDHGQRAAVEGVDAALRFCLFSQGFWRFLAHRVGGLSFGQAELT